MKNGLMGLYNNKGEVITEPQFKSIPAFSEGLAAAKKEIHMRTLMNKESFFNGLGLVTYEGEWGYLNRGGEWVYKPLNFN